MTVVRECWSRRSDRKSTRLNSSHGYISYAVFCLKKKKKQTVHSHPKNQTHCRPSITTSHKIFTHTVPGRCSVVASTFVALVRLLAQLRSAALSRSGLARHPSTQSLTFVGGGRQC